VSVTGSARSNALRSAARFQTPRLAAHLDAL
jgi:hypothetical protein